MAEAISAEERASIEAVVSGVRRRSSRKRRTYRRGWGSLAAGGLMIPVLARSLDGSISMTGAVLRVVLVLVVCWAAADLLGGLMERYQATVAVNEMTKAVERARAESQPEPQPDEPIIDIGSAEPDGAGG